MSSQSGRSWYRFSSSVRPTPRDPSLPRRVIKPLRSPDAPSSPPPPPQPLSTPLRPPPKEVQKAKLSPATSSRSIKHEAPKHRHEEETTYHENILTISENTNHVHGPNKEHQAESDDVIMGTQGVITISGENKGAVMDILRSPSKTRGIEKGRRHQSSSEDNGEGKKLNNSKKHYDNVGGNGPMDGFVNSNVQMVNGSVVYNSTENHHDPGVHLSLYRKPSSGNGFIIKNHGNGYNSSIN